MGHGASTLCAHVDVTDQLKITSFIPGEIKSTKTSKELASNTLSKTLVDSESSAEQYPQKSFDLRTQPEFEIPDASSSQIIKSSTVENEQSCQINHHTQDLTIHPVGDLVLSQISHMNAEDRTDLNNVTGKHSQMSPNMAENGKPSAQSTEEIPLEAFIMDKERQNLSPDAKFRAGDLNINSISRGKLTLINLNPADILSNIESNLINSTVDGIDLDKEKTITLMSSTSDPGAITNITTKKATNTATTQTQTDRPLSPESSMDAAIQCPSADAEQQRDSSLLPMCPEDFASYAGQKNSKHRTIVKLPKVNDHAASIHEALAIKFPLHSYNVSTECNDLDNRIHSPTMDIVSLRKKPFSDSEISQSLLVDRSVCRYNCTQDVSTLTINEKLDAQTSMYACVEDSRRESHKIIPEVTDLTTTMSLNFRETQLNTATNKLSTNQSMPNVKEKPLSKTGKPRKLYKCVPLPTVKHNEISPQTEFDLTTITFSATTDPLNSTIRSRKCNNQAEVTLISESNCFEQRTSTRPLVQVEQMSSYTDEAFTNPASKENTKIIMDDETYPIDGPYNVDMTREAVIRTPSLEDTHLRRSISNSTIISTGVDSCTAQLLTSVSNRLLPTMVQTTTTTEAYKRSGSIIKEKAEKETAPVQEQNKATVQAAPDVKCPERVSSPKTKLARHSAALIQTMDVHRSNPQPFGPRKQQQQQQGQYQLTEVTDFLQLVQSADDFEILPDESALTETHDLGHLKVGKRTPINCLGSNKNEEKDEDEDVEEESDSVTITFQDFEFHDWKNHQDFETDKNAHILPGSPRI